MHIPPKAHHRALTGFAILLSLFAGGCESLPSGFPMGEKHPDFSGVWVITEYDEVTRPDETGTYTEEAKENIAFYNENFDPVTQSGAKFCDMSGMPWTMLGRARDYPREIYQSDDRLFYLFEYMDSYRQIRIGDYEMPENFPGTREGYSIAHWEGDELVIVTEGFTPTPTYSNFHRGYDAKMTERWRKLDHPEYGETIEITIMVEDPDVYTEPAMGRTLIQRAEPGTVLGQYGCPATLWEEYADAYLESLEAERGE